MLVMQSAGVGIAHELGSVVSSLRAETLAELPDARVEQDYTELHEAVQALEAERLRRLAEFDRRRLYERDGHLSTISWLAGRFCVSWGAATSDVRLARGLDVMPAVRRAFEDGVVSLAAVRVLAEAREAEPEAFRRAESLLTGAASRHSISDLRRAVVHWRHMVERERAGVIGADEVLRARRRLHASVTLEGMVRLDGDLDPETGETFMTAIRAVLDADARSDGAAAEVDRSSPDERTPAQRRADALAEICRGWLDRSDRPSVAGERPHLNVTVPLEALGAKGATGAGGATTSEPCLLARTGELEHTGALDHETVRRLACDATLTRIVLGAPSEPLDVGRKTPVVSSAIRRAVIMRDRHCRFPGCDRPQSWCDAHHVRHWADGGETSLANLVLLCRRHHTLVHGGFSLAMVNGRPVFRRADGSVLDERADRAPPYRGHWRAYRRRVPVARNPELDIVAVCPAGMSRRRR